MKIKNIRGQIKIQQTAFMLVAVTLLFAFVALFIFAIFFSNLKGSTNLLEQKNALLLVSKLADSPEFSCENAFGRITGSCIDADKVMALKDHISKYSEFWGVAGIEIREVYPGNFIGECTSSNYPNCGKITILETNNGTGVSNFVSLCRKSNYNETIQDVCELGKLIVIYKAK